MLRIQAHRERELAALIRLQALDEIHFERVDVLGIFASDLFDIDTAPRRCDERYRFRRAINQYGKIQFFRDIRRFANEHAVHRKRASAGLIRLHRRTEHLRGRGLGIFGRLDQFYAAGLAATTRVNLRFHHPLIAAERARGFTGLFRRCGQFAGGYGNAVVGKHLFGLILVEIHA